MNEIQKKNHINFHMFTTDFEIIEKKTSSDILLLKII